jgi:hypothetical protein
MTETFCLNVVEGALCNWLLAEIAPTPRGEPEGGGAEAGGNGSPEPTGRRLLCPNGHEIASGDLLCSTCGAFLEELPPDDESKEVRPVQDLIGTVNGWSLVEGLPTSGSVASRYLAHHEDGRQGVLTIFNAEGAEPDPEVYEVLRRLSLDHVPEIYEIGRLQNRAFDVAENVTRDHLGDFRVSPSDTVTLRTIAWEIAKALRDFNRIGLRHRDLRPQAILIRTFTPLDLVVDGFGSAQLSEHDLETVAPLEQSRYMAPEAVAGAVSPASDWWSLGIMLLEKVTGGRCFEGVSDQAFLIDVMAHGVVIPEDVDPDLALLLRGLLVRDHQARWKWSEFERWHGGDPPELPPERQSAEPETGSAIEIGGASFRRPSAYALAAAKAEHWDEAVNQLLRGEVLTWLEDIAAPSSLRAHLRGIDNRDLPDGLKLTIALKYLNPNIPLVHRGNIISPAWLLKRENVSAGRALLSGDAADLLAEIADAKWLLQLRERANAVRRRARHHEIELDQEALEILELSSNRAQLASQWAEKRRLYPDTELPALGAVMDRRQMTEEDLILLLGASLHQLTSADEVIERAVALAAEAAVETFDKAVASETLQDHTRVEMMRLVDERTADFARCGNPLADEWADQFRVQRRTSLPRALVMLSVAMERWQIPKAQAYVQQIISFFESKVTYSIKRGPLARMTISRSAAKLDLIELGSPRASAKALLGGILAKAEREQRFDPQVFIDTPEIEMRLRRLYSHALMYQRDTGINGLYLGFPFVVLSPSGTTILPRIAPILLWPIKLFAQPGRRDTYAIAFDSERDEIRLNPALESFLGESTIADWKRRRETLLAGSLDIAAVLAEFARDFGSFSEDLARLPPADVEVPRGTGRIACSAVLFHVTYMGQAIVEDLKALKSRSPDDTALATLLRVAKAPEELPEPATVPEIDRYFTADSDPSQEEAVWLARREPAMVIEGPPGTGKSQTIVNLICDAIGRKRSVAIVCQKQAALEVVNKRLLAEGLADRLVLLGEENKDRKRVLMDIRNQLETLRTSRPTPRLEGERRTLAQRIEAIERELAEYHEALHAYDSEAGVSYRELIGELIQLDSSSEPTVENYPLRRILRSRTSERVTAVEEEIAPLAGDWLAARYENSPLEHLEPFGWDETEVLAFQRAYSDFENAENRRVEHERQNRPAFETQEPDALARWRIAHQDRILALALEARADLGLWHHLFHGSGQGAAQGQKFLEALKQLVHHLAKADPACNRDEFHSRLWRQTEDETRQWVARATLATREVGLLGKLSPVRWGARYRIRKLIRPNGETIGDDRLREFLAAAKLELHIKSARRKTRQLAGGLSQPQVQKELRSADLELLKRQVGALLTRLVEVSGHMAVLLECPAPTAAVEAARNRTDWMEFLASCGIIERRHQLAVDSLGKLARLSEWMSDAWAADLKARIACYEDSAPILSAISDRFTSVGPYQRFRARSKGLSEDTWTILAALRESEEFFGKLSPSRVGEAIRTMLRREARTAWKARIEAENPILLMTRTDLDERSETLGACDLKMRNLNRRILVGNLDRQRIGAAAQWEGITRLQGPRAIRLREFISRGAAIGLMELRPVWLMNPDTASRLLPLRAGMFDLIIYDEASQMPIEYALPSLYRCKSVVISGDEKQLPPTSFFHSKVESTEAEIFEGELPDEDLSEEELEDYEETWNRREIKDCPDLLALGRSSVPKKMLLIHYRSRFRELIEFSNDAFYRGDLNVPARHPDHEIRKVRPIEVHHIDGVYTDQTNPEEAAQVVTILAEYWKAAGRRPTIGVVSFNRKQADLIEELLVQRAVEDESFRLAYQQEQGRKEAGEDMSFFVKNVENVQGDERDVIIFSTTFGRNGAGRFRRNFGVLGQKGGERRLNVAITRAREKVVIATSMPISEISDLLQRRGRPQTPRDYLQGYLQYAALISAGDLEEARASLRHLNMTQAAIEQDDGSVEDGFLAAVGDFIRELGYEPDRRDDGTAFGLDYAVPHPAYDQYGIGVECDAPRHRILATARARELWRPKMLARAIPRIHRVSSYGWYHDPETEKNKLADAITAALAMATVPAA